MNIPLIKIFELDSKKWKSISGPDDYTPFPKDGTYRKKIFYRNIKVTDSSIYALYSGKSFSVDDLTSQNANILYRFNKQGLPETKYILDKGIYSFDIYKDSVLYGVGLDTSGLIKLRKYSL